MSLFQIYLYLFLRNDALIRYHGYFLSSTQTISILNLFNAFYIYAANFLTRCFYLLLLHRPVSCCFSFHFCKLFSHISSITSQVQNTYCGRDFLFSFLYLIKGLFMPFIRFAIISCTSLSLQHLFSLTLQF